MLSMPDVDNWTPKRGDVVYWRTGLLGHRIVSGVVKDVPEHDRYLLGVEIDGKDYAFVSKSRIIDVMRFEGGEDAGVAIRA